MRRQAQGAPITTAEIWWVPDRKTKTKMGLKGMEFTIPIKGMKKRPQRRKTLGNWRPY